MAVYMQRTSQEVDIFCMCFVFTVLYRGCIQSFINVTGFNSRHDTAEHHTLSLQGEANAVYSLGTGQLPLNNNFIPLYLHLISYLQCTTA